MLIFFMEQMMVILDECGLCFRTAACIEGNYLSNPFSDLNTYVWLKIQYVLSQKGNECKQSSDTLSCTSEFSVLMVSLVYNVLVMKKEVPFIYLLW